MPPPAAAAMVREPRDGQHQQRLLVVALSVGLALTTTACAWLLLRDRDAAPLLKPRRKRGKPDTSMPVEGSEVFPPLPPEVVALLQSTRLCHLSTTGGDGVPHLSLMNFTYLREEEAIIMTTRTDTKKFELLQSSPKVAILVHDFPQARDAAAQPSASPSPPPPPPPSSTSSEAGSGSKGNTYSITLNGVAKVQAGKEAERYRALHLQNNQAYAQFITGPSIAVLTVHVVSARICNVQDRVTYWDAAAASKAHGGPTSSSSSSSSTVAGAGGKG